MSLPWYATNLFKSLWVNERSSFVGQTPAKEHRINCYDQGFKSSRFRSSNEIYSHLPGRYEMYSNYFRNRE